MHMHLLTLPFWCVLPHPQAYKDSGDTASKKGDRIWIAEMYGYSFGAAKTNVWHKWHHDFMLYPSYTPSCESVCNISRAAAASRPADTLC